MLRFEIIPYKCAEGLGLWLSFRTSSYLGCNAFGLVMPWFRGYGSARLPGLNSPKLETVDLLEETINESFRKMSIEWIKIWVGNPTLKLCLVDQLDRKQKVTEGVLMRVRELQGYINDTKSCEE